MGPINDKTFKSLIEKVHDNLTHLETLTLDFGM